MAAQLRRRKPKPGAAAPKASAVAEPVASAAATPGDALRAFADAQFAEALAYLGWRGGRVHRGVHLARKALRRLRATLALGGAALGPGAALIDRELRRLNRGLSDLRDAQASVEALDRLLADQDQDAAVRTRLRRARRAAAAWRAAAARHALADDPGLQRRRALLQVLRAAALALPWSQLDDAELQAALAHSAAGIAAAQARTQARGRDGDWHRWRRRERRLSQQRRALQVAGIALDAAQPAADKRLGHRLGLLQDLSLLRAQCRRDGPFAADRRWLAAFVETELDSCRQALAARLAAAEP